MKEVLQMRLIHMKCPDCGSILDIDTDGKPVLFCQFCGSKLLIDDEIKKVQLDDPSQAGYEFEQGRIRAQKEERRKEHEKQEKIAEAKRVMEANYQKQHALAEQGMADRNTKYTLHGWLLFLAIIVAMFLIPGSTILKIFLGVFIGCIIWASQSAKCKETYEHSYQDHVETDDEGSIIHADRL